MKMLRAIVAAVALATAGSAGAATVYKGNFRATGPFSIGVPLFGDRDLKIVVFSHNNTFANLSVSLRYELAHIESPDLDYYIGLWEEPIATYALGMTPNFAAIYVQPPKCDYSVVGGCTLRLDETVRIEGTTPLGWAGRVQYYVTAAPEPSTWAMLIAGFGLAGAGLRKSRGQRLEKGLLPPPGPHAWRPPSELVDAFAVGSAAHVVNMGAPNAAGAVGGQRRDVLTAGARVVDVALVDKAGADQPRVRRRRR
jgi:hypothetical protein